MVTAWSMAFSAVKLALRSLGPVELGASRTVLTAVTLWAWHRVRARPAPPRRAGDRWRLLTAGVVGIAGYNLALAWGTRFTPAGTMSLVAATTPLLVAAFAAAGLRERLAAGQLLGMTLAFCGVVLMTVPGERLTPGRAADLLVVGALPLSWALYTVLLKPLSDRYDPIQLNVPGAVAGAVATLPLVAVDTGMSLPAVDGLTWVWVAYLGILAGGLGLPMYTWLLRRWTATAAASVIFLIPIGGLGWAWLLVGETPGPATLIGTALVLGGLALEQRARRTRAARPPTSDARRTRSRSVLVHQATIRRKADGSNQVLVPRPVGTAGPGRRRCRWRPLVPGTVGGKEATMLVRWDPFRDFDRLAEEVWGADVRRRMQMDAYRHGDEVFVHLDLPGVEPETIDVTLEGDTLTVKAERTAPWREDDQLLVSERHHGSFTRQLLLGDSLDREKLTAKYERGVLVVTIPVAEEAKPRHVPITKAEEREAIETT